MSAIVGNAWVFGDDIGTDTLAPGLYMKRPIAEIAAHCLETVDPRFATSVGPGDIVVAGRNFGMGSSREQAAQALVHLGVAAVLARSYGGIFYRNALNLGLLVLICPQTQRIAAGERIAIEPEAGRVRNLATGESCACEPIPAHLMALVRAGGLVPFLEQKLKTQRAESARPITGEGIR
jgi:3-isopropylmalate/(R)-2-methylmalate dehydratase small subunit